MLFLELESIKLCSSMRSTSDLIFCPPSLFVSNGRNRAASSLPAILKEFLLFLLFLILKLFFNQEFHNILLIWKSEYFGGNFSLTPVRESRKQEEKHSNLLSRQSEFISIVRPSLSLQHLYLVLPFHFQKIVTR